MSVTVPIVIAAIGGIAFLVGLFGGGIQVKEIKLPKIPGWARLLSSLTGVMFIGVAAWLSSPNTASPTAPSATPVAVVTPTPYPTHTPYTTYTPYPTYTPVPPTLTPTTIPMPTPISLSFEAPICQCKDNYDRLRGPRIFLRDAEFRNLGVPVGTLVTLEVIVDGTESHISGLILDNDIESSSCTIRLCKSPRESLNPTLGEDAEIPLERRPIRQWQITVEH